MGQAHAGERVVRAFRKQGGGTGSPDDGGVRRTCREAQPEAEQEGACRIGEGQGY
jgi:hypothetical protein